MVYILGNGNKNYIDAADGVTHGMDTIYGLGGDDTIFGLGGDDSLHGGDGNDYLYGGNGADTLNGGNDNDHLVGGAGGDILNGGNGFDQVSYVYSSSGVTVSLLTGYASGGEAEGDTLIGIEGVIGSFFADTLAGDDNENTLSGDFGADTLKGYGGDDVLKGGWGDDWLFGMDGNDSLNGGADADTFVWAAEEGNFVAIDQHDLIEDFNAAEGDKIDVQYMDATTVLAGNQAFNFIGDWSAAGGFTAPGQVAYTYAGGYTFLLFNTDDVPADMSGNAESELVIRLEGEVIPDASWFIL